MARAENQGLQIALIVFVMLTIVLAVVTFFYVRNYQEAVAQNVQLQKTATDSKKAADATQLEINKIKEFVGVDVNMTIDKVQATFDEDMKQFAATLPADKLHYHDALESLWTTNQELFAQSTKVQAENRQLQDQLAHREEERDRQIKEFREKSEAQASDTVSERNKFDEERRAIVREQQTMVDKVTQKDNEKAELAARAAEQQKAAEAEIKTVVTTNVGLLERLNRLRDHKFEVADGKVVYRTNDTVYLNLGTADRLVPLTTFSVHDKLANTAQGDGLKARIEVTEILGDHLASARVLDENLGNPIGRDDKVYTPLWHKGDVAHFAILGTIDLDQDGKDDRQLVRDLITSIGGVIDAEMDIQGKITGKLDINTRYLVEGKIPPDRAAVDGAAILISKAEQLGVERIPAPRFFEQSGWKWDSGQIVQFGRDGTRERIPFEPRDGSVRRATSVNEANFAKRRPWTAARAVEKEESEGTTPEKGTR